MESNTPTTDTLRTEKVRWNLARYFYTGIDDPQLNTDVEKLIAMYKDFHESHKDKLAETLPQAIRDWAKMGMLESKIGAYIRRMKSLNVSDSVVKAKDAQIDVRTSKEASEYCEFFVIELAALDDAVCERWYKEDEFVRKHKSWIAHIRLFKQHMLSEEVESATTKFEPFGDSAWDNLHEEFMSDFEIEFRGEKKTFEEILDTLNNSPDAVMRAEALALINKTLGGWFGKFAAETLWMLSGSGAVADEERKYAHPMQAQNMSNRVSDEMVLALHNAVRDVASPIMKRFYKLKANLLGLKVLPWSDRNAAMPFSDSTKIPYDEALKTVLAAYEALSPVLAEKVLRMHEEERVDAPAAKGKADGAYCSSIMLSDGIPRSFLLLNYLGSNRDVMTLAHEAGHGVHGELAGEEQGALMFSAPTAYAETASIFGEMTTFNYLKKRLIESGDKKSLLALLMIVIDDSINSVVRQ
ncbi:MAG: M3 family metallopeptidase, partial [Patescibacteria group bacterium]